MVKTAPIPDYLKGSKIIYRHDDGDLTVEHKGTEYVVTTEGQVFREINPPRHKPYITRERDMRITRKMPRLK